MISIAQVNHLPIVADFARQLGLVDIVNQLVQSEMTHVHFDTTSVNVFGDYTSTGDGSATPAITYGYSKDKRPDLKQWVLSLLCIEGGVPIVGKHEDGNASDSCRAHRHHTPSQARPGASYRVSEQSVELYGTTYRAIVVPSSAHDKCRQKRLERERAASLKAITTQAKAWERKTLFCQADAEAAAREAMARPTAYHRLEVSVVERPRYGRGRPKRDSVRTPIAMEYGLVAEILEDTPAIECRSQLAGCFVRLSNVARDGAQGCDAVQILRTYIVLIVLYCTEVL